LTRARSDFGQRGLEPDFGRGRVTSVDTSLSRLLSTRTQVDFDRHRPELTLFDTRPRRLRSRWAWADFGRDELKKLVNMGLIQLRLTRGHNNFDRHGLEKTLVDTGLNRLRSTWARVNFGRHGPRLTLVKTRSDWI